MKARLRRYSWATLPLTPHECSGSLLCVSSTCDASKQGADHGDERFAHRHHGVFTSTVDLACLRMIESFTLLPGARAETCFKSETVLTGSPLQPQMTSPLRSPAMAAGLSAATSSTSTPIIPMLKNHDASAKKTPSVEQPTVLWQAQIRSISGLGERSAYGLPDETGVLVLEVAADSPAAKAGLRKDDVIRACDGHPVKTDSELKQCSAQAAGSKLKLSIIRKQVGSTIEVNNP